MARTRQTTGVEFVGGPFDGHFQSLCLAADELLELVAIPVNGNLVRMLVESNGVGREPPTSIAVYEREKVGSPTRYRFLGATTPSEVQLATWRG